MNSKKLIEIEGNNTQQIHLYREGLFWKAYERSAYAFCVQYRNYKPTKKYVKVIEGELISIGFPTKVLSNLVPEGNMTRVSENEIVINLAQPIGEEQFVEWKKQTPLTTVNASVKKTSGGEQVVSTNARGSSAMDLLAERIVGYNLADHTPMEAMQFICELKEMLKEGNTK